MRFPACLLILSLGLAVSLPLAATPALGHSLVERSTPTANSALDTAPRQVDLWFNEPVDQAFSTATVVDPAGVRVSERATVSSDGRRMTIPLRDVSRGFYTVRWRVLSAVDGHTTSGAFAFTVGLGVRPPAQFGGSAAPEAGLAVIRWIGFTATLLLAGAVLFPLLVLRPGLRRIDPSEARRLEAGAARPLRVVVTAAAIAVVVTAAIEVVVRAVTLTDAPVRDVIAAGQVSQMLWGTKPGWGALIRGSMAALLLLPQTVWGRVLRGAGLFWFVLLAIIFAMLGGPAALAGSGHLALVVLVGTVYGLVSLMLAIILPQVRDIRIPDLATVPPLTGAAMLAGLTVTSHAWGSGALAAVVDWVHLLAVAVWIGGLACLIVVLTAAPVAARAVLARGLVPGFSRAAAVGLGGVVVTGLYGTWLHVPSLRAMIVTDYGRFLTAKLVLVVPVVALGALNRFVVRPRLEAAPASKAAPAMEQRRFLGLAGTEAALGGVILLVVALLTATPPARTALATAPEASTVLRYMGVAGDVGLGLAIDPAKPGPNHIEVTVAPRAGQAPSGETRALLRVTKLDEDLTPSTQTLTAGAADRYSTDLTLPSGWYVVEVILRRRGQEDLSVAFPLRLGESPPAATDPAALRLLDAAAVAMRTLRTWREEEQITDGFGGVTVVQVEVVRPDRLRVRASGGAEAIFVGATRYLREGPASWKAEALARPVEAEGVLQYLRGAASVVAGRSASCDGEPCRVIMWEAPDRAAAFAALIGERTPRIHNILMVAPQHYMTGHQGDFNAAIRIEPPR